VAKYNAKVTWQRGPQKFTDLKFSREHDWSFDGGIQFKGSASPHVVPQPLSSESAVDPEEAFVASLSSCHMLTFLYVAAKQGYVIDGYADEAVGVMTRNGHGKMWVSKVTLAPAIVFAGEKRPTPEQLDELHHLAHEECFIANSVKSEVVVQGAMSFA